MTGPRGVVLGWSNAGSEGLFYIKNRPGCCPENVPELGNVGAPALALGERRREAACPAVASLSLPRGQGGAASSPLSEDGSFPRWPGVGPGYVVGTGA